MAYSGAATNLGDLQTHVGWASTSMPRRHSRADRAVSVSISEKLRSVVDTEPQCAEPLASAEIQGVCYEQLPPAFP